MNLGVNGIRLTTPISGVGRYLQNVLRSWGEVDHPFEEVRVYLPDAPLIDGPVPPRTRFIEVPRSGPRWLWEQVALPRAHGSRDILFCPSYVAPLLARCPIFLVHHGSYEAYPQAFGPWIRFKARHAYSLSARRADRIVTVSESSRRDMVKFYGLPHHRIEVIPEGVDTALFRPILDPARLASFRERLFGEDVPFMLYVGKPSLRRNIPSLLDAFSRFRKRDSGGHRLLLVGGDLPGLPLQDLVRRSDVADAITVLGHASHPDLALAYNASSLFLYPSSYEGFGIPVLEAMACGTPAIALRNTSFPEFADGVAHLVESAAPGALCEAMERVLGDAALCERMRKDGPERARGYDWGLVASRTMASLRGLAEEAGLGRR